MQPIPQLAIKFICHILPCCALLGVHIERRPRPTPARADCRPSLAPLLAAAAKHPEPARSARHFHSECFEAGESNTIGFAMLVVLFAIAR